MAEPVSVKAALSVGDRWVLLKNDRGEWELPGGQIDDDDESLEQTLRRECSEEIGIDVVVADHLGSWMFEVLPQRWVNLVCFAATATAEAAITLSDEHQAVGLFSLAEVEAMEPHVLPWVYRDAIAQAAPRNR